MVVRLVIPNPLPFFFFHFPFFLIKDGNGYIADEELDALMHDLLANTNQVTALQLGNCLLNVLRTECDGFRSIIYKKMVTFKRNNFLSYFLKTTSY